MTPHDWLWLAFVALMMAAELIENWKDRRDRE